MLNFVKKLIPKISDTELIALKSGTTSVDRNIFEGKVDSDIINKLSNIYNNKTNKFKESTVNNLLSTYKNEQVIYPNNKYNEIFDYVGKNKFF